MLIYNYENNQQRRTIQILNKFAKKIKINIRNYKTFKACEYLIKKIVDKENLHRNMEIFSIANKTKNNNQIKNSIKKLCKNDAYELCAEMKSCI